MAGVLQGDYWPGNLLVTGGRIGAVIDWLETRRDWLGFELGRAIWEFCSDRADAPERRPHRREHTLLDDRARPFLDAYLEQGGPARDLDLLVDMMRISVLIDVLRDLTYEGATDEVAGYHIGSIQRLDHLAGLRWP